MPQGTIKKLSLDRGFGFIAAEDHDVFFHHSAVKGTHFDELEEGQAVEYEIAANSARGRRKKDRDRGPQAACVRPVSVE